MTGTRLGIAGVGLIGGSIALRAHALGATVIGYDRDPAALAAAQAAGALDEVAASLSELAARSTLLALALPVDATVAALRQVAELDRPELVFDVASVKGPIVAAAAGRRNVVASHPLAGREVGGFGAADADLFAGRTWAIVPGGVPPLEERLARFITELGARPLTIGAADHDRLVAISSHLPQLVSVALGAVLERTGFADPRVYALCGPGMRSMLRLAHSDAGLWQPIVQANAAALREAAATFGTTLESVTHELGNADAAQLVAAFEQAHRAVDALEEGENG